MAKKYKVLGQVAPSATTATTLYTVPSSKEAIISTIVVANRNSSPASYRIAVRPAGETLAVKHYIAFDVAVGGGDSTTLTLGITLDTTDVITIYASSETLSFSAFGSEIDS
jgi:glucose-6-phosphate dehydrogenase assembly protein OpcA